MWSGELRGSWEGWEPGRGFRAQRREGIWGRALSRDQWVWVLEGGNVCVWKKRLALWSPTSLTPGTSFVGDSFSVDQAWGDGFGMIQAHYIYCALYFCYYCISSASDYRALDLRGRGPLCEGSSVGRQHEQKLGGGDVAWSTEAMGLVPCLALEGIHHMKGSLAAHPLPSCCRSRVASLAAESGLITCSVAGF